MAAVISYRNLADSAVLTMAQGSVDPAYPLARLQTRQLSNVCRLPIAGNPVVQIDLGSGKKSAVFALLNINAARTSLTPAVVLGYSTNGSSWTNLPIYFVNDLGVDSLPRLLLSVHGVTTLPRYWRFTPQWQIFGPGVGSYYEIGRLWLADAIVHPRGVDDDWTLEPVDAGEVGVARGLEVYESPNKRGRVLRVNLSLMDSMTAHGIADGATTAGDVPSIQGLTMEVGNTGEVIVVPRASSALWTRRLGVYGRLDRGSGAIRKQRGDYYATSLSIIEER